MEEVEGGADGEEHVVVVPFVQNDENQIANLETKTTDDGETRGRRATQKSGIAAFVFVIKNVCDCCTLCHFRAGNGSATDGCQIIHLLSDCDFV